MKLFYYNTALKVLDKFLTSETALSNKHYKEFFYKKLEIELRETHGGKHFDMWYKRMWDSLAYSTSGLKSSSPGMIRTVIELGMTVAQTNSLKSMCGIQPMTGPVGLIYTMNYREVEPDETDIVPPPSEGGKSMILEIVSNATQAMSRKLATSWTLEAIQEGNALHEVTKDIVPDMMAMSAQSIDEESVKIFMNNALAVCESSTINLSSSSLDGRSDWTWPLIARINSVGQEIHSDTNRGPANVMWASKLITEMIKKTGNIVADTQDDSLSTPTIEHVGKLSTDMDVYTNHLATSNKIIIGYKGVSETDAGVIFAPYVPVLCGGIVMNVKSLQPELRFMTRYGMYDTDHERAQDGTGATSEGKHRYNYYRVIDVKFPGDNEVELLQEAA